MEMGTEPLCESGHLEVDAFQAPKRLHQGQRQKGHGSDCSAEESIRGTNTARGKQTEFVFFWIFSGTCVSLLLVIKAKF